MDTVRPPCRQTIADARKMRTLAAASLVRARAALARARAFDASLQRVGCINPALAASSARTPC
jgi:hypothetical protein